MYQQKRDVAESPFLAVAIRPSACFVIPSTFTLDWTPFKYWVYLFMSN